MKSKTNLLTGRIVQVGLLLVALVGIGQAAQADTLAADHVIRHTVTVFFEDLAGTETSGSDSVDVTVNLVASPPIVAIDSEIVIDTDVTDDLDPVSVGQTVTLVFNVTSTANGEDGYFVDAIADATSSLGSTTIIPSATSGGGELDLGATSYYGNGAAALASASLQTGDANDGESTPASGPLPTQIIVPADSNGGDAFLNGFQDQDLIVFNADNSANNAVCRVNEITQPAGGSEPNATASLWVDECVVTGTFSTAVGDSIGEQGNISITVVGTAADLVTLSFEVNSENDPLQDTTGNAVINILAANIEVYKFVRNETSSSRDGTCTPAAFSCLQIGSTVYYRTTGANGVTANPDDVLEYAVLIYNRGGEVQDVRITDTLPTFTSYEDDNTAKLYINVIANGTSDNRCDEDTSTAACVIDNDGAGGTIDTGKIFDVSGTTDTTDNSGFLFVDTSAGELAASAGHTGSGDDEGQPPTETAQADASSLQRPLSRQTVKTRLL